MLLGPAQVISATVALYLLLTTGMSNNTLGAVIVALTFPALSRLIFHGGKPLPTAPVPARSDFMNLKIAAAPVLGAVLAVFSCRCMNDKSCCPISQTKTS